jgi:hypothetical protein
MSVSPAHGTASGGQGRTFEVDQLGELGSSALNVLAAGAGRVGLVVALALAALLLSTRRTQ